ncbi:MAG: 4Fe-4S binding protein [Methanosarcinaceae archaeon]|jgi:ferredoxin|nr:4Fe-4S binding protein [Methanosarcinaceae archaeon]NKQ38039.1 4Fe-4S binding protein [Methanosarcinales archaeon]
MTIKVNRYKCGYCGACVGICPISSIELIETWIEIDETCTECGLCAKICPVGAIDICKLKNIMM